ncbi:MAG: PAS domain-containing sensor histidine kinase [Verrucomicrobia bacterium]|nr:PAS domain-containing sensor histidine kinase [Verrucomicrobiota bacterium]
MVSLQQTRSKSKSSLHRRVVWMATIACAPSVLICFGLMWVGDFSQRVIWTFGLLAVGFAAGGIAATRASVVRPLQTLANVLAAVREGDYSLRVRGAADDDSLGAVVREVNTLGETLRVQRLGAQEAEALLRKVMEEIPVGIFAFTAERKLVLVNRSGAAMLARTPEQLRQITAAELGLEGCLQGAAEQVLELDLPGAKGRFNIHRDTFREGGKPHELLVLNDVSAPLREEERQAWQRLVRVLGHEINNSLAPIRSLTGSLKTILSRNPLPEDWAEDVIGGLDVIGGRAESLNRFMSAYASLARLPKPNKSEHSVGPLVERVAGLEQRMEVAVEPGPEISAHFDADQIEQVLVNLIKNGVEAVGETAGNGGVCVRWSDLGAAVEIVVLDEGPGLSGTKNLFVPFFTTKPKGSGIGLVLCRQIAEAHGGSLTLENRTDRTGCAARLVLPK